MAGRNLTLAALKTLDRRLHDLAGFVHQRVQQAEDRAEKAVSPRRETPEPQVFEIQPGGPPAHWLEKVRQAQVAPGFHDAASGQAGEITGPGEAIPVEKEQNSPEPQGLDEQTPATGARPTNPSAPETGKTPGPAAKIGINSDYQTEAHETARPGNKAEGEETLSAGNSVAARQPETGTKSSPAPVRRSRIIFPNYGPDRPDRDEQGSQAVPAKSEAENLPDPAAYSYRETSFLSNPPTGENTSETPGAGKKGVKNTVRPMSLSNEARTEPGAGANDTKRAGFEQPAQSPAKGHFTHYSGGPNANWSPENKSASQIRAGLPDENIPVRHLWHQVNFGRQNEKGPASLMARANLSLENYFPNIRTEDGDNFERHIPKQNNNYQSKKERETQKISNLLDFHRNTQKSMSEPETETRPWPELPPEDLIESEIGGWQQIRRKIEHLQRLEDEQRGTYGTGRLFD